MSEKLISIRKDGSVELRVGPDAEEVLSNLKINKTEPSDFIKEVQRKLKNKNKE